MKALIIYAHPRKESFSHALLKQVQHTLCEKGLEVEVRDLYQLNFQPVLAAEDTIHVEEGKFVRNQEIFPPDVLVEQEKILESDLLIYVFPIWWNGMPAILKGYIDRVFQHGFAYSFESDEPKKRFAGKKAIFLTPTGQPQAMDGEDTELTKAIKLLTSEWIFNGVDVEILGHLFLAGYRTCQMMNEKGI